MSGIVIEFIDVGTEGKAFVRILYKVDLQASKIGTAVAEPFVRR